MSKLYVLYFVACYAVCIQELAAVSLDYLPPSTCTEPQSKNINWPADYSNKFKRLNICDVKVTTKAVMDNEGRWIISLRANTKNNLEAEQLCECMRKFLFQSDWTDGAIHVCKPECTSLTIFVIGARNPNFIGLKPVTDTCEPLKTLAVGLDKFPDVLGQLGGKNCKSTTGRNTTGQMFTRTECDNDPEPQKICDIIYDFLNAEDWLDSTTDHECYVKNNKLYLEVVEKADIGYCY